MTSLFCRAPALIGLVLFATAAHARGVQRDTSKLDLSQARQSIMEAGFMARGVIPLSGAPAWLFCGRGVGFVTQGLFLGGSACGGSTIEPAPRQTDMGYAGILIGFENFPGGSRWGYEVNGLLGGFSARSRYAFVVTPEAALKFRVLKGLRVALRSSYLWVPGAPFIGGGTVGLSVEFRNFSLSWPE